MFQVWLQKIFKVKEILDINMIQFLHFEKERADDQWHEGMHSGSYSQSSRD